jgi:hypothetical protein
VAQLGARYNGLSGGGAQAGREGQSTGVVKLAHDVVQEHHGQGLAQAADRLSLGEQQSEESQALLPLRAIGA